MFAAQPWRKSSTTSLKAPRTMIGASSQISSGLFQCRRAHASTTAILHMMAVRTVASAGPSRGPTIATATPIAHQHATAAAIAAGILRAVGKQQSAAATPLTNTAGLGALHDAAGPMRWSYPNP